MGRDTRLAVKTRSATFGWTYKWRFMAGLFGVEMVRLRRGRALVAW